MEDPRYFDREEIGNLRFQIKQYEDIYPYQEKIISNLRKLLRENQAIEIIAKFEFAPELFSALNEYLEQRRILPRMLSKNEIDEYQWRP